MKKPSLLLISLGLACLVVLPQWGNIPHSRLVGDAPSYIQMAEGHSDGVLQHHARRILHPWLAGRLGEVVGLDTAFLVIGILSLVGFLWLNLDLLSSTISTPFYVLLSIVFLPSLFRLFYELYLPTLFFIALSGVFWLLQLRRRYLLCLPVLFLMYLTRDETLLLAACWLLVLWRAGRDEIRRRTKAVLTTGIIAVSILGVGTVSIVARANTNMHRMSNIVFAVTRMPLFYMSNITGFEHWVDTYRTLPYYGHEPLWAVDLPPGFRRLTSIRRFGIYRWNPADVVGTLLCLLGVFGTGPTILLRFRKGLGAAPFRSLGLRTTLLFGLIILVCSPGFGPPNPRYYISAWPLFLFFLPRLLGGTGALTRQSRALILFAYFLSAWIYILTFWPLGLMMSFVLLAVEVGLHGFTWRRLGPAAEVPI
jgi:hypothetical protein